MESVKKPVCERTQNKADDGDERQPAEEGINPRENFSRIRLQRVQGAHAGQNHGGIREGVHPRKGLEMVVPLHADAKANGDAGQTDTRATGHAGVKRRLWEQGVCARLKHKLFVKKAMGKRTKM